MSVLLDRGTSVGQPGADPAGIRCRGRTHPGRCRLGHGGM